MPNNPYPCEDLHKHRLCYCLNADVGVIGHDQTVYSKATKTYVFMKRRQDWIFPCRPGRTNQCVPRLLDSTRPSLPMPSAWSLDKLAMGGWQQGPGETALLNSCVGL